MALNATTTEAAAIHRGERVTLYVEMVPQPPTHCNEPLFDCTGLGWFYDGLDGDGNCDDYWPQNDDGIRAPFRVGETVAVKEPWKLRVHGAEYEADSLNDWIQDCECFMCAHTMPDEFIRLHPTVLSVRVEQRGTVWAWAVEVQEVRGE